MTTVRKMREFVQEWAADPTNKMLLLDENRDALRRHCNTRMAGSASSIVEQMGTYHLVVGQAAVLRGEVAGWQQMRLGSRYRSEALLLRSRHWRNIPDPGWSPFTPLTAAHTTAVCLALADPEAGPWLDLFRGGMSERFWQHAGEYPRFMQAIADLRAGDAPRVGADLLGDYAAVIESWRDVGALEAALNRALDRHRERSKTKRKGDLAEFEDVVVYAFPAEVLAVVRVREAIGLPVPELTHALWQSPLTCGCAEGPWPSDDTLATIMRLP
ncbi:MAG: hypothetical protein R3F56_21040 [Planctomycetota bacterium]